jgi:hypothetical protein
MERCQVNVDEIGHDLYGLSPDRFIEARNARAKELVASGDREAAAAVRRLPKPAHSAWLANVLVRRYPHEIDELLDVGRELRQAQAGGAGGEMRRLSGRRHELVQGLVVSASDAARTVGHKFGKQLQSELEETLDAAVADPSAAAELRGGQLAGPLRHIGFGEAGTLEPGSRVRSQGPKESRRHLVLMSRAARRDGRWPISRPVAPPIRPSPKHKWPWSRRGRQQRVQVAAMTPRRLVDGKRPKRCERPNASSCRPRWTIRPRTRRGSVTSRTSNKPSGSTGVERHRRPSRRESGVMSEAVPVRPAT